MASQDVREIVPRVRRAVEGPQVITGPMALTDEALLAVTADAIADVILFTAGQWQHKLLATTRDSTTNAPTEWAVDPGLELEEESVVAAQAAITFFFHQYRDMKVSEHITNEGQSWEWAKSATIVRDQIALLKDTRDRALTALAERNPVMARYASILHVRDRVGSAIIEPWTVFGTSGLELGGGQETGAYLLP